MLCAMQEPGLVNKRAGTILDVVVLRGTTVASSCGRQVKPSELYLGRKGGGVYERSGRQWRAKVHTWDQAVMHVVNRHFTCDITTQEFVEYSNFADTVVQDIACVLYESTIIPRNMLYDQASQNRVD